VPENDYRKFLRESANVADAKGEILTKEGRVLATTTASIISPSASVKA